MLLKSLKCSRKNFKIDKRRFKIINTLTNYSLKTLINLIFALSSLHNFIKDHFLQDIDYFKDKNEDLVVPSGSSDNLLFDNSEFISIKMNKGRNAITNAILVDFISYLA